MVDPFFCAVYPQYETANRPATCSKKAKKKITTTILYLFLEGYEYENNDVPGSAQVHAFPEEG